MDSARWQQIQNLFHETVDRPADEQAAILNDACGEDESLRHDVLALLQEDGHHTSLLDRDLAQTVKNTVSGAGEALPFHNIGPYRILRLLGEGGMGVVYLAEREDLGSRVAIKVLRDAWMSPARRDRFIVERRTLARLSHASIARLYDADSLEDGTPWFAMEYVEGVPLTEYCLTHEISVQRRLQLFRSICEAVEYAHGRAVIHRDLKPANILVKEDGSARLLDFGIAKDLEDYASDRTRTGLRLMTPAYAAPEQIRGEQASVQTDVYSLGVILYELLAERAPFDPAGFSSGEWENVVLSQDAAKPSAANRTTAGKLSRADGWADLDVLCLTAMHKDPARRYRSVEALIRDIDHYLKREPLEARPDTLRYRASKFIGRNRNAVVASIAVLTIVLALVIFFTVRLTTARNAALAQAARTKRIQQFMLNLFDGGDKDAGPAEDLRVIALIDRGVQEARALSAEPGVQAELYQTLGGVYQKLGKLEQADTLLQLALNQRRALPDVSVADVAESQVAIGLLRVDQAKLDEAERLVRQGLEEIQRDRRPYDPALLKATTALGKVLEVRGEYAKAIAVMEGAVRSQDQAGLENQELADALGELADNHFYAGHYDMSDSLNTRVLAMHKRFYGDAHPKVAEDLINLGAAQLERGHYAEAERFDREALAIHEKFYGPDHPETASALTLIGRALYYQKRYEEAGTLLQRALAIQERVHGAVHPAVASALNELGNIASMEGRYADAERSFARMVEIYRSVYHDRHYLIGIAESNLATVYMNQTQYARAEALYREAIRRFTDTLSPGHVNTAIARIKLGRTLLREKRYTEAEGETLAGYGILSKQANPSVTWLKNARKDLAEIYETTHQPEKAKAFQEAKTTEVAVTPAH